jgi:hypothetical protein
LDPKLSGVGQSENLESQPLFIPERPAPNARSVLPIREEQSGVLFSRNMI